MRKRIQMNEHKHLATYSKDNNRFSIKAGRVESLIQENNYIKLTILQGQVSQNIFISNHFRVLLLVPLISSSTFTCFNGAFNHNIYIKTA